MKKRVRKKYYTILQMGGTPEDANPYMAGISVAKGIGDALMPYNPDEYGYSKNIVGRSTLNSAASGAALGTAILPGIGTAVGAGVGAVTGLITGNKAKKKALKQKEDAIQNRIDGLISAGNNNLINYDTTGTEEESNIYALGGPIYGGRLNKLNSDTVEVEGRTHAEGGVKLPNEGIELENNETVSGGNYVFSDKLGFAQLHRKIANQIGRIEKKPLNRERRTTLEILRKKEQGLKNQQEAVKTYIGQSLNNAIMQMGGYTPTASRYIASYTDPEGTGLPTADEPTEAAPTTLVQPLAATLDQKDPVFTNEQDHLNYYRDKAIKGFDEEDMKVYNKWLMQGGQRAGDAMIAARGGLPAFTPKPVTTNWIPTNTPTTRLPKSGKVTYRPEKTRLGIRTKSGGYGFRFIR